MREVAAYTMDSKNFCNVPATMLVHCEHSILNYPERDGLKSYPHPKLGSLQKFCNASGSFIYIYIYILDLTSCTNALLV
jgi:hypothetical protein